MGRLTVTVRNVEGLTAFLKARDARQRARVRAVTERGLDRVFHMAQSLCPRDTHYMALHMLGETTRNGTNFFVGWKKDRFVGEVNEATGEVVTEFYPPFVVFGTRFMAGRDPLTPALQAERANLRRGYARALSDKQTT